MPSGGVGAAATTGWPETLQLESGFSGVIVTSSGKVRIIVAVPSAPLLLAVAVSAPASSTRTVKVLGSLPREDSELVVQLNTRVSAFQLAPSNAVAVRPADRVTVLVIVPEAAPPMFAGPRYQGDAVTRLGLGYAELRPRL